MAEIIRSVMPDSFGAQEADEAWQSRLLVLLPEYACTGLDRVNSRPIDFIFVNGFVKAVAEYGIIREKADGIYPSDHYPVFAALSFYSSI